jgi:hypothetical protein
VEILLKEKNYRLQRLEAIIYNNYLIIFIVIGPIDFGGGGLELF